jgi:dienelactone hydrolase
MQMMKKLILIFILIHFTQFLISQPVPLQLYPDFSQSNNIRQYLIREAGEITDKALTDFHSREEWEKARPQRYNEMIEMLSLTDMPLSGDRPDLNVRITGTVQQPGFRIEKLYYESLPGLYVPANLYIPDNIKKPAPAILYQCGHSHSQKVHYQAHARRFAELGFVCLIVETIQYGEVFGEHWGCYDRGWFNWYSRGYTPAGVEVWNGIRGVDLLLQRSEVDKNNIGVTGISGGGALSWFIGAVEPRIKAVAPVCGNSTLKSHIATRTVDGHCDCMMMINTYLRDFHDIGALIAPRPLYIAQADRDGLNSIESSREVYYSLKDFYELFEAKENIRFIQTPGGHSYHKTSRQGIFAFFMEHLMDKEINPAYIEDVEENEQALLDADRLEVYVDGPPVDDRTKFIQDSFVKIPEPPVLATLDELNSHVSAVKSFLLEQSFQAFPDKEIPLSPRLVYRTDDYARYGNEVYTFDPEEDWRLKLDIRWRNSRTEKRPLMIVLRNPGEKRDESEMFISELDDQWNIAFLETRGTGEAGWSPELQWHVRRASAWTGRTIASMRIYDLIRCLNFIRTLDGVDQDNIGIAARGEMAVVASYAALLDGGCQSLILKDPPDTQDKGSNPDGRGEALEILNCLKKTDVWQLPALLYPARIYVMGSLPETYRWSENTLNSVSNETTLHVIQTLSEF